MAIATATTDPARRYMRVGPARFVDGLILLAAAFLAAAVFAANMADLGVRTRNPLLLERASSFSPAAAGSAAEIEFAAGHADRARMLALESLREAPLSAAALRTLGFSAEAKGDLELAARAMTLAAGLGWRDVQAQLWLTSAYIGQGDYASALQRADAVLRRKGDGFDEALAIAMAAALEDPARPAMIERLSQQPEWRADFFEAAHLLPQERFDAFERFLGGFRASGQSLKPAEMEGFVANVYQSGQQRRARNIWRRHAVEGDAGNALFDGDFTAATLETGHRSPFEWSFPQRPGSETRIAEAPGRNIDRALHAASGGNVRTDIAAQHLTLTPGGHVLSFEAIGELGARPEGFSWTLQCSGTAEVPHPRERRAMLPSGWSRIIYGYEVPASNCDAQRLTLWLRSDRPHPVSLWIDKVVVTSAAWGRP